ncbi:MAG TPA: hypothetical protein DCL61_09785 [Cyanobacteria bacterium UBA12227]|nr:hypothetical protein [Cyanobacteria bacterium UBA12227]HAX86480.1 hypothetical protein [Cyanobacteria bacterium UBA11370]HBY76225.1 hypothetical protein [Cyanobacteria bacterium UBA11148]
MVLLRGALIEYASDFLGPLPNVVIFQFNPDTLTRNISIPQRPTGVSSRETSQAGEIPVERINFTAHFSAADQLDSGNIIAETLGISPQLAALEKMVYPSNFIGELLGEALDAIGDAIGLGGNDDCPTQPIPREQYPQILFIWGATRVLPVLIDSMSITEQQYDSFLNPIQAEVALTLAVASNPEDKVGKGALKYSNVAKEAQAIINLANTVELAIDLIPF